MIHIADLQDHQYCPELRSKNGEKNHISVDYVTLTKRLQNRKKRFDRFTQIRRRYFTNHHVRKKYHQPENFILYLSMLIILPLATHLFAQTFYLTTLVFVLLLVLWAAKVVRKHLYRYVDRQVDPVYQMREERKVNDNFTLIDPDLQLYGRVPKVQLKKGKIYVIIERTDKRLPSFFQSAFKSDVILATIFLHMLKVNFLIPENKLMGEIRYKNHRRARKVDYGKYSKSLMKQVQTVIKNYHKKNSKTQIYPFRCEHCTFVKECNDAQSFPKLKTHTKKTEDVELHYKELVKHASRVLNTTLNHWKQDVRNLVRTLHQSELIHTKLHQINKNVEKFDIKQLIESAILFNRRLTNSYLSSTKKELAFSYQLLLYLATKGRKREMEQLINFYGMNQGKDMQTSPDIKIKTFFQHILRNFIDELDQFVAAKLPDDKALHIHQTINSYKGQVVLGQGKSHIEATLNINEDEEIEDENEDIDDDEGEMII